MSEYDIQAAFVKWCKWNEVKYPSLKLAFSSVNGAHLAGDARMRAIKMARLKANGLRVGVPDWSLPVARNGYAGMWIEFKAGKNKLSHAQAEYIDLLRAENHLVHVYYDWEKAAVAVKDYLQVQ